MRLREVKELASKEQRAGRMLTQADSKVHALNENTEKSTWISWETIMVPHINKWPTHAKYLNRCQSKIPNRGKRKLTTGYLLYKRVLTVLCQEGYFLILKKINKIFLIRCKIILADSSFHHLILHSEYSDDVYW